MSAYLLGETPVEASREADLVGKIFDLDPARLDGAALTEFEGLVAITTQFSRFNTDNGQHEVISPSRIAAIPAITARYCKLVEPARGQLTTEQVKEIWLENMPANDGSRHPDQLFDIAQFNFGHDGPVEDIVRGLTMADIRRQELREQFMGMMRLEAARFRNELPLDLEASEEAVESMVDEALNGKI